MKNEISFFSGSSSIAKMSIDQVLLITFVVLLVITIIVIANHITNINSAIKELDYLYCEIKTSINHIVTIINDSLLMIDKEYDTETEKLDGILHPKKLLVTRLKDISSISNAADDVLKLELDKNVSDAFEEIKELDKFIAEANDISDDLFLDKLSPLKRVAMHIRVKELMATYNKFDSVKKAYNN